MIFNENSAIKNNSCKCYVSYVCIQIKLPRSKVLAEFTVSGWKDIIDTG